MNNSKLLMTIENCWYINENNKVFIKGCVKSGRIGPGDKVYIIDTYGKRISTTVEAAEMFGKHLDYAESGDNNVGILLGNNIMYDDIQVGNQIVSDVSLNATEAESVIEDSYDDNELYKVGIEMGKGKRKQKSTAAFFASLRSSQSKNKQKNTSSSSVQSKAVKLNDVPIPDGVVSINGITEKFSMKITINNQSYTFYSENGRICSASVNGKNISY